MDNNYFPTAKQALEYTNGIINKKLGMLYSDIKEKIMAAANKGEKYIYYYPEEYCKETNKCD